MIKKRPMAKIDTSAIEGILNLMADKLQHMHDRLNYLAATMDAFDPQEVRDEIRRFQDLAGGKLHSKISRDLFHLEQKVDLLGRRITKKRSKGEIYRDRRIKAAKKAARTKK